MPGIVARDADRLSETATDLKERYAVSVETIAADLAVRSDVVGSLSGWPAPSSRLTSSSTTPALASE